MNHETPAEIAESIRQLNRDLADPTITLAEQTAKSLAPILIERLFTMASKFKKDQKVRQIVSAPIEGEVKRFHFSPDTGEMQYQVHWTDAEGVEHQHAFNEDQIEAVEDVAPVQVAPAAAVPSKAAV
jgi:hypothetical protein